MLGWMNHKLESRLPGEMSITSYMQMIPTLMAESEEQLKSLLMKVKEESEKAGLKLSFQKTKILASSPIQFSCSVMSDSSRPHGPQHTRPTCPSPTPGVNSNSSPLSRWCHPTISSSVIPFSSCLQPFPESGSFQMSQLFASSGQSIGSFSFNISHSREHSGLISLRMDWLDLLAVPLLHGK